MKILEGVCSLEKLLFLILILFLSGCSKNIGGLYEFGSGPHASMRIDMKSMRGAVAMSQRYIGGDLNWDEAMQFGIMREGNQIRPIELENVESNTSMNRGHVHDRYLELPVFELLKETEEELILEAGGMQFIGKRIKRGASPFRFDQQD